MATILVVDDQEPIRALLRDSLEGDGHEVFEAANGRLGLELYRKRPADLIITDMVMPEMNGLDMLLELTRKCPNVNVIAMSGGRGSQGRLDAAELLGTRQTFQKPLDVGKLLNAVRDDLAHCRQDDFSSTPRAGGSASAEFGDIKARESFLSLVPFLGTAAALIFHCACLIGRPRLKLRVNKRRVEVVRARLT